MTLLPTESADRDVQLLHPSFQSNTRGAPPVCQVPGIQHLKGKGDLYLVYFPKALNAS